MFQTTNQYNKIILIDSYDIPCYSHRNPMKIGLLFAQRPLHGGSMKGARPARSHLDDVSDTTKISDWGSYSTEWGICLKKSRIFQGCNEDIYGICIYIYIWIYTYIYIYMDTVKQGEEPDTPKEKGTQFPGPCMKQQPNAPFCTGHLSHAASSGSFTLTRWLLG